MSQERNQESLGQQVNYTPKYIWIQNVLLIENAERLFISNGLFTNITFIISCKITFPYNNN